MSDKLLKTISVLLFFHKRNLNYTLKKCSRLRAIDIESNREIIFLIEVLFKVIYYFKPKKKKVIYCNLKMHYC